MSEPHGDDSTLPPAAPEAAVTEGSAPDASSPLARPRRTLWQRVGGEGLALSVLIHILLILIAVVWVVSTITDNSGKKDPNTFATGAGGGSGGPTAKQFKTKTVPKNIKSLAKANTRITSKNANSTLAVASLPSMSNPLLSAGAVGGGSSKGFGGGSGGGIGSGRGAGVGGGKNFVSLFGAKGGPGGAGLIGTFYDLKQTAGGSATKMADRSGIPLYRAAVREFVERGWSPSSFSRYYKAPDALVAGQLYIPTVEAQAAPKAYGVEKRVKESRWVVHYKATVEIPSDLPFRFVGSGDDWLIVRWNRKVALDDGYESFTVSKDAKTGAVFYKDFGQKQDDEYKLSARPLGRLKAGPWISGHKKGDSVEIEVLMGETPGGLFDVYLTIEAAKSGDRTNNTFVGEGKLKLFRCNTDPLPDELTKPDAKHGLNIDMEANGWIFKAKRQTGPGVSR
jgi:hypothetical protein